MDRVRGGTLLLVVHSGTVGISEWIQFLLFLVMLSVFADTKEHVSVSDVCWNQTSFFPPLVY